MVDMTDELAPAERVISPELRQVAEQHAAALGVPADIHPDDFIFWYIHDDPALVNKSEAPQRYLQSGKDTVHIVTSVLAEHRVQTLLEQRPDAGEPLSLLDFASGYGRVTRHFQVMLPHLDVWGCDIHQEAVTFMRSIGLQASRSSTVPEELSIGQRFNLIFSFSFFTHMPRVTWRRWLQALSRTLKPDGLLIFTAHGEVSQQLMRVATLEDDGFFFHSTSEQKDLDEADYGNTVTAFDFVNDQLAACGLKLLLFREAGAGHHDVYVVRKIADEPTYYGGPIRKVETKLRTLEADKRGLEQEIAALRSSTSWKLTAPLRALIDAVRKR